MLNGEGLRVVLWVAGCEHKCKGCHNQMTWDINGGLEFDDAAKREIFDELEHDYISGITFSGGDPLHTENRNEVGRLICEIREKYPQKSIWVYTGYEWRDIKDIPFMTEIDVVVDGKFIQSQLDPKLYWRGSVNQKVIDAKESIRLGKIVLLTK